MGVSYKKLFKLLIDRDMKKKDLRIAAGLSPASVQAGEGRICQHGSFGQDMPCAAYGYRRYHGSFRRLK